MTDRAPKPAPRSWTRRLLRYCLFSAALGLLAVLALILAITWKPAWYQPVALDFASLDADKAFVASTADRVGDALIRGQSVTLEFDEAQLNRILAARDEWPQGREYSLGPISDPYIDLRDDDRIRLGARASYGVVRAVVSATFGFKVTDELLTIRLDEAAAGVAPAPGGVLERVTRQLAEQAGHRSAQQTGEGLSLINDFVWPNGRIRYRVSEIRVDDSKLRLTLKPW